jgi:hypothetical protein
MKEGWLNGDYLILLDEAEVAAFTAPYGIDRYLPGFSIVGLRGWDDFIVADQEGRRFTVPTVPLLESHLQPFESPVDASALRADARFIGKIKWYIQPVVFGGDPSPGDNLTWVNLEQHAQLVRWWNEKYKSVASDVWRG